MALTKQSAEARFACIKTESITYDFNISLEAGTHYDGFGEIQFQLTKIPTGLTFDLKSEQIKSVTINSQPSQFKIEEETFVSLDVSKLNIGLNHISVLYRNKYDNDGSGCVSFTDVDTKQYLYTQFQPFFANRVFPLFDQPDLKAKMRLNVICPSVMKKILSNEYAILDGQFNCQSYSKTARTSHPDRLKQFLAGKSGIMALFPETKMLPTYLYCFVAGDYQQLKIPNPYKGIPMSLYSIQSLYEQLKQLAPFLFQVTIESMKFFQSFFGFPYSFNKYDQIFVHEYKWGAMQNAGIVTFNDVYVWKEKVSTERMLGLANTVSHELAHHWFGNLVTMKWWDDLWLNQSFADFISHFCLQKIKNNMTTIKYESSMASFLYRKGWGYHEDQRVTTHPIRGEVANTSVAESIFDGITYSKGAATMKQLLILMGQENFSKALSQYFTKFAWKNTVLSDFITEMQKHFKNNQFDLAQWRTLWLERASLNQLEVTWDPHPKDQKSTLKIKQTAVMKDHPTLRPHKIGIGFFNADCTVDVVETLIRPIEDNQVSYDSKQYKAILLNYGDYSFVKIVIDPISLNFFSNNLPNIKDILSRTLIWKSFFDMLKDAKMTSVKYIQVFIKNIIQQESDSIFEKQFDYIHAAINSYTPIKYRNPLNDILFYFILTELIKSGHLNNNRTVILKERLCNFASTPSTKKIIIEWKQNKFKPLSHLQMTIGQQWKAVVKAFTLKDLTIEQKEAIFQEQKAIDSSDTSKLKRLTCDALKSTEQQYEKLYLSYQDPKNQLSVAMKNASTAGWNHEYHSQRLLKYNDRYFKDIIQASKTMTGDHLETFVENLQPFDDDLLGQIKRYQATQLPSGKFDKINTEIKKIVDDLHRRYTAYQLYEQQQSKL